MDFRFSNSVAALAVLLGGGCVLLAPAARAGDRIEFSTPTLALAVPKPDVEIKETKKVTSSPYPVEGMIDSAYMAPQPQVVVAKPRNRGKDPWDSNPLQSVDPDQGNADAWLSLRTEPNRLTNSGSVNMQRGWDSTIPDNPYERGFNSRLGAAQNPSRFGAPNGFDKENSREGDRFERGFSMDNEGSFWSKAFNRDTAAPERFNAGRFADSAEEARTLPGGAFEQRFNDPVRADESAHTTAPPAGYENYRPGVDDSQNRQTSDQTGEQMGGQAGSDQGYLRAWEPAPSRRLPYKRFSSQDPNNAPRGVAPNAPVNLQMPKRPGSPF
jgi:hypothetical protein